MSDEQIIKSGIHFSYDEHGHPELGKVSKAHIFNSLLQLELNRLRIKVKSRPVEIGYEVRCIAPTAFDLKYCSSLGNGVKKLFDRKESGCIVVSMPDGEVQPLYLKDIADENGKIKPRLLNVESESYRLTFNSMDSIKEEDYKQAKKYLADPKVYNLNNILDM